MLGGIHCTLKRSVIDNAWKDTVKRNQNASWYGEIILNRGLRLLKFPK